MIQERESGGRVVGFQMDFEGTADGVVGWDHERK